MTSTELLTRVLLASFVSFSLGFLFARNGIKNGYYLVKRIRNNKEADMQLSKRLKKIESEIFEFEK